MAAEGLRFDTTNVADLYVMERLIPESKTRNPYVQIALKVLCEPMSDRIALSTVNILIQGAPTFLKAKLGPKQITLAMIMAIKGHNAALEAILPHCELNAQDKEGWTALHHATIVGNKVAKRLFVRAGADMTIRNRRNGTATHLARTITLPNKGPDPRTGFEFTNWIHYAPSILVRDWLNPQVPYNTTEADERASTNAELLFDEENQQRVGLLQLKYADDKTPLSDDVGNAVVLKDDVPENFLLWPYAGQVVMLEHTADNTHDIQIAQTIIEGVQLGIRGLKIGNAGSRMPHGPPSVRFHGITNVLGMPVAHVGSSLRKLYKGSIPCIDYGHNNSVQPIYEEICPTYTRTLITKILRDAAGGATEFPNHFPHFTLYIFNTHKLFLKLLSEKVLGVEEIKILNAIIFQVDIRDDIPYVAWLREAACNALGRIGADRLALETQKFMATHAQFTRPEAIDFLNELK